MLKDYFEVPNKPAIKSGNVLSCDFTDHETFIPQPLDFTRNTLATYVDCNGLIKVSGVSDIETVVNGNFTTDTDWNKTGTWKILNGKATASANSTSQYIQQDFNIVNGEVYKFTYEIIENTLNGNGAALSSIGGFGTVSISNEIGYHTQYITVTNQSAAYALKIGVSSTATSGVISIDNISLKKVDLNTPRIDYLTEIGKAKELQKPSLLLEPQRTNNYTYSSSFTQTYWLKQNGVTVSSNQTKSPEDVVNADKLISANATSEQYIWNSSISTTSGDDVTISCFVKKLDYDYFHIRFTATGGVWVAASAWYNISDGTVGTVEAGITAKIENYGNGWYRCSATRTATGTGSGRVRLQLASSDNTANVVGDGTKGTFIYGAQWEVGSYATSYIPTYGSAVTRNGEVCNNAGQLGVFNSEEGVLYCEIAALASDSTAKEITISDGTTNNRVIVSYNTANQIRINYRNSSTNIFDQSNSATITDFHKIAVKWKVNDFSFYLDGSEVASSTSGSVMSANTLTKVNFDDGTGNFYFYGKTRDIRVFRRTLTDSEMTELTNNIT
jgi:hypothetical protein